MTEPDWREMAQKALKAQQTCPATEDIRLWLEHGPVAGNSQQPLGRHLESCPRCRLEASQLAAFFDLEPVEAGGQEEAGFLPSARPAASDLLVETIRQGLEKRLGGAPVVDETQPAVARFHSGGLLAWAAVLLAGVGLLVVWQGSGFRQPPPVPSLAGGAGSTRAAGGLMALQPAGVQEQVPRVLAWRPPIDGPANWEVHLERVDGKRLWSARVKGSEVELPAEIRGQLQPGSRYIWRIISTQGDQQAAASFSLPVAP